MAYKKTALLTLGRLPKALDVAEALNLVGWRVIIAEPFAWHLCRVSRHVAASYAVTAPNSNQKQYLEDLLDIINRENVQLVVPVSEEALHATLIESRLPGHVTLYSAPHAVLRELHDKWQFAQYASGLGLQVPQTALLGSEAAGVIAECGDYIMKPACTCSGQGFEMRPEGTALPDHRLRPATVVQECMTGALKSSFSIASAGKVIGTVVYHAAILSGSVAVAFERLDNEPEIERWIETFVGATDYNGFLAFDFMEDQNGVPHAIECNPRITSGIHFVDRDALAGAILDPQRQNTFELRPQKLMYQFWPSLTETQIAMLKADGFPDKIRTMWQAKEVNFAWTDPLPLWSMPATSWQIMRRSFLKGESFGEASTFDIGWYEPETTASDYLSIVAAQ